MKEFITNNDNLKEFDVTEVVQRVKALIINDNNDILIAYSYNDYHFPGGHVEENESLNEALKRELMEETGINVDTSNINPFACSKGYWKDWPEVGKNRKTEVYYYEIRTNELPNLDNIKHTENEKEGKFNLKQINLNNIEEELTKNNELYGDKYGIGREMLELFKVYKTLNNSNIEKANANNYLDKEVNIIIDRPLGTKHPKHNFIYVLNYGYIPNTISGDGEELDAYLLGEFNPVDEASGKVIAVIHRTNDDDDKLIVSKEGKEYSDDAIRALTEFQERFFESEIVRKRK